ncbi:MAG: hypothetical protein ACLQPD_14775 [Desulfomonilaceae bacterium]
MKEKIMEKEALGADKPMFAPGNKEADFDQLVQEVENGGIADKPADVVDSTGKSELVPGSIDAIVDKLRQIAIKTIEVGYEDMGEVCLAHAFNYDLTGASSRNPRKNDSFNAICRHRNLPVDPRRLGEAVKAAALTHELRKRGLELDKTRVTFTHKVYLSRIPDVEQRIALAIETNENGYPVSKLKEIVALALPKGTGGLGKAIIRAISKPNETLNNEAYMTILKNSDQLSRQLSEADRIDLRVKSARTRQELLEYCGFLEGVENSLFDIELSERGLLEESSEDELNPKAMIE